MSMSEFFSKTGEFMSHYIHTTGESPQQSHESVFFYKNGQARYDSRR